MLGCYRKRRILLMGLSTALAAAAAIQHAIAASAAPVFSPTAQTGWVGIGIGALIPVPGLATADRSRPGASLHLQR